MKREICKKKIRQDFLARGGMRKQLRLCSKRMTPQ
jgi:hypothetical protein